MNTNIGFRPALSAPGQKAAPLRGAVQSQFLKGTASPVKKTEKHEQARRRSRFARPAATLIFYMAKTYGNLYRQIYQFDHLHDSYLRARRGKRLSSEHLAFARDLEPNLIQLQNELIWKMYRTGAYRYFCVYEPKKRLVAALPFRDRVVQHAAVSVIEPIWERRFIFDSYACRPGKGTHAGADRAERFLRIVKRNHGHVFALKGDISQYFPSIDHDVLKRLLWRRIRCRDTLALLDGIIDSTADSVPVGLPIGNLTSQLFANIYLHELDVFVKQSLRERYYLRYMDDFVVIHHDKKHLQAVLSEICEFLWAKLRLKTNRKTQIFPVATHNGRGLDFLGYRTWPTHRKLRKGSIKRQRARMKRLSAGYGRGDVSLGRVQASVSSWVAHAGHASTYNLRKKVLNEVPFYKGAL